jgi:periplasmic protein TonB
MYERNSTVALEEKPGEQAPVQKLRGPACHAPNDKPIISANLSAGMLENNRMKRPRRAIDFFLSMAGHGLLLATAILLPLYFSDAIDLHQMQTTYLVSPPLPPPPPASAAVVRSIPRTKSFFSDNKLYAPRVIPKHIVQVKDLPSAPQAIAGVPGGVIGGVPGGQPGGVIGGILGDMGTVVPLPSPPKPVAHRGPYVVGGKVRPPRIIQQVQPIYPILAKAVHVHGDVVIDSVIDANGNVTEMKLVSGNPLLVTAAFDAVGQWKYQPTLLNGTPVAVEMQVTVHFNLAS